MNFYIMLESGWRKNFFYLTFQAPNLPIWSEINKIVTNDFDLLLSRVSELHYF